MKIFVSNFVDNINTAYYICEEPDTVEQIQLGSVVFISFDGKIVDSFMLIKNT